MPPSAARPSGVLRDIPASGWAVVALAVTRTLLLSAVALAAGAAVDRILAGEDAGRALVAGAGLILGVAALAGIEAALPSLAQVREERRERTRVVRALHGLPLDAAPAAGESAALATDDVERAAHYRAAFLGPLAAAFVVPLVVLAVIALQISAGIAAPLAACVALIPPILAWFMTRFRAGSGRFRMISGRLAGFFLATIRALGAIRLLGGEDARRDHLRRQAESVRVEAMRLLRRNQIVLLVTDALFGVVMLGLVGALAVAGVRGGGITVGAAFALLLLTVPLREPVDSLGRSFYVGLAGRAAADRVRGAAAGHAPAPPLAAVSGRGGDVEARALRVERDGRTAVDGADLVVAEGVTAIVGPSGAGKSSLALALSGLLPATGARIGGAPADAEHLRAAVVYVPQRSILFSGTVRENLLLGDPAASDPELRDALVAAGFSRGGEELPAGLDTVVGEDAQGVSGGQAQRISIARALLTRRPALVLDEPTAQLDPATAERVVETLRGISRTRRVLLVTHRLGEALRADRVAVVEDGRTTAFGPPDRVARESPFLAAALETGSRS